MDTATRTFGNVEADSEAPQLSVVGQLTDAIFESTGITEDCATAVRLSDGPMRAMGSPQQVATRLLLEWTVLRDILGTS